MGNNFEQYETLLGSASETAEACLDMEGGTFFLAWAGELIQDLATAGYFRSAWLTAQRLCDAVSVDLVWAESDELASVEKQVWLNLFAGILMDHVITATYSFTEWILLLLRAYGIQKVSDSIPLFSAQMHHKTFVV